MGDDDKCRKKGTRRSGPGRRHRGSTLSPHLGTGRKIPSRSPSPYSRGGEEEEEGFTHNHGEEVEQSHDAPLQPRCPRHHPATGAPPPPPAPPTGDDTRMRRRTSRSTAADRVHPHRGGIVAPDADADVALHRGIHGGRKVWTKSVPNFSDFPVAKMLATKSSNRP